jgi:hypothetical protein
MPKEHLNSENMTPVIKKLQNFYTLPEHEDLPYLIEAIVNDRAVVDVLLSGAIAIRDICGPGRARIETRSEYRCSKCAHSDISVIVKIPSTLSMEQTHQVMEALDKRLAESAIHHEWVTFVADYVK